EVDPGHGVQVGDDGIAGQRAVRSDAGAQGLEGENPLEPRITEELGDLRGQPAEAAAHAQPGQVRTQQVVRGVEVPVDEALPLQPVQAVQVIDEPQVAVGLPRPAQPCDLRRGAFGAGADVQG